MSVSVSKMFCSCCTVALLRLLYTFDVCENLHQVNDEKKKPVFYSDTSAFAVVLVAYVMRIIVCSLASAAYSQTHTKNILKGGCMLLLANMRFSHLLLCHGPIHAWNWYTLRAYTVSLTHSNSGTDGELFSLRFSSRQFDIYVCMRNSRFLYGCVILYVCYQYRPYDLCLCHGCSTHQFQSI